MGCHLSGGSSEGSGPPYFQTKLRPEGKKKILETPPPQLSKGLDDWGPTPLSSSSGSGTATGLWCPLKRSLSQVKSIFI